jgi:hypothetical protein
VQEGLASEKQDALKKSTRIAAGAAVPSFAAASSNSSWPSFAPSAAAFAEAPLGSVGQGSCSSRPSVTGAGSSAACNTSVESIIANPKCTEAEDSVWSELSALAQRTGPAELVVRGLVCSRSLMAFTEAAAAEPAHKVRQVRRGCFRSGLVL